MITTILFDLDGTLLPMNQDEYIRKYTGALANYYIEAGFDPEQFPIALFHSIVAAIKNNGEKTNEQVFWDVFCKETGKDLRDDMAALYRFYAEIHPTMCSAVQQNRNSRIPLEILREKGYKLVLATNPVFPRMATYQRMSWAGFTPDDFKLVTTYENSCTCKPNPQYFLEVAEKVGSAPEECLMIGNDTRDDMAALTVGMQGYIITDFLIDHNQSIEQYPHGTWKDFQRMALDLPNIYASIYNK